MTECKHTDLEFLGSQKTDEGENRYVRCRSCGDLIVITAGRTTFSLKGTENSKGVTGQETGHHESR